MNDEDDRAAYLFASCEHGDHDECPGNWLRPRCCACSCHNSQFGIFLPTEPAERFG